MSPAVTIVVPVCTPCAPDSARSPAATGTAAFYTSFTRCLESLCTQDFSPLQIIVVDDNALAHEQKECRSFITQFQKQNKKLPHAKDIEYICLEGNRGLVEARRTGFENAKGAFTLTVDSDDMLVRDDAVSTLYHAATGTPADGGNMPAGGVNMPAGGYDIVHCATLLEGRERIHSEELRYKLNLAEHPAPHDMVLDCGDLSSFFLGKGGPCLILWAKLYKTQSALEAFSHVPNMYCVLAEDLVLSYFFSREMHSYRTIDDALYSYTVNVGISSDAKIFDAQTWNKTCSVSSVFTAILYDMEERPFEEGSPVPQRLNELYYHYITSNALALAHQVDASLYDEAREIFIEAWGEESALKAITAAKKIDEQNQTTSHS